MPVARSLSPSIQPRRSLACVLLTVVVGVALSAAGAADSPLIVDVLHRAGEQVRRFEQEFTSVISEESYRQYGEGLSERQTHAEMLFLWLQQERILLTVRNVLTVDGQPVAGNAGRVDEALKTSGPERLALLRQIINDNARLNVGRTKRNFNYPTLVLSFLDPDVQLRFKFSLAGREKLGGVDTWKVNYQERSKPTVIQGDAGDIKSRGSVWVTVDTGAVARTRLELTISKPRTDARATVVVEYQQNPKLGLWVPAEMHETYLETRGSVVNERIGGDASYSNFRRFEAAARMVSPG